MSAHKRLAPSVMKFVHEAIAAIDDPSTTDEKYAENVRLAWDLLDLEKRSLDALDRLKPFTWKQEARADGPDEARP